MNEKTLQERLTGISTKYELVKAALAYALEKTEEAYKELTRLRSEQEKEMEKWARKVEEEHEFAIREPK